MAIMPGQEEAGVRPTVLATLHPAKQGAHQA
jgi:hypothetical protein